MIVYPAEYKPGKEAVFTALAEVAGGGRRLRIIPLSFRDFPETRARVALALARAKRQPRGAVQRWLKWQLLRGQYNWARRYFLTHPQHVAAAWNGLTGSRMAFLQGAEDAGAAKLHAELAPLPDRITLDPAGCNAESSVPQTPGFFRDWRADHPEAPSGRDRGRAMVARASRRADVQQHAAAALPQTPFLFCPLQVPDDSQVTLFAGWVGGMAGFLAALAEAATHLPPGWHLRVKEHPSARSSLAEALRPLLAGGRVVLDNESDSFAQLAASAGVVTLNSSMGLQAFFHDRPVITLGRAFFALPGLVEPAPDQAGLNRLFAQAGALRFDAELRADFLTWLAAAYYPQFSAADPKRPVFDRTHFAAKLNEARHRAAARAGRHSGPDQATSTQR